MPTYLAGNKISKYLESNKRCHWVFLAFNSHW